MQTEQRKRTSALQMNPVAKASNYIWHVDDVLRDPDMKEPGAWGRVSRREQNRNRNLDDQIANLDIVATDRDRIVGKAFRHVGPGWDVKNEDFAKAIRWAKRKPGRFLLAEDVTRWLRSLVYHSNANRDATPTGWQFEQLLAKADGVILATVLHPDAPRSEVESFQRKRGRLIKGRKGGRPKIKKPGDKKRWREKKLPLVLKYQRQGGSVREIAGATAVPFSTVSRWIRQYA